jgi:hypothetical protein
LFSIFLIIGHPTIIDNHAKIDNLLRMQQNITLLAKQAIKEALKANWDKAIEINSEILQAYPQNIDAKLRLGHAFIQTKHLIKAKKVFNEVISHDPLNPVALKNIQLIDKKVDVISPVNADPGALIKEPGTTIETKIKLVGRGMTAESFAPGENLVVVSKRSTAEIYRVKKDKDVLIGEVSDPDIIKCISKAFRADANVSASFKKGEDRIAEILIKSTIPVFKSEKQDVRPYIKKGSLDEGEGDEEEEVEVEVV